MLATGVGRSLRRSFSTARALVLNAGSSSIKYGLYDVSVYEKGVATELCSGICERIGEPAVASIRHKSSDGAATTHKVELPDHGAALGELVQLLTATGGPIQKAEDVAVVGHRVVHGGTGMTAPAVIDDTIEAVIENCIPLAPLHNPAHLLGIRRARARFPAPHVAVFDTAFHSTMPPESHTYALPKELKETHGVRKYGFHGTSYTYLLQKTAAHLGRPAESLNLIMFHLGNGASMAAVKGGKCIDTSMGLTPLEGLVMGTRSGDVDGGVLSFLGGHLGYSAAEIDTILNKKSGLMGLCGTSDWRAVSAAAKDGNPDAQLARAVFIERVRKYLGAFLVKLNGKVDALVFSGGIGENDASLRADVTFCCVHTAPSTPVCAGLETFGIAIDPTKNEIGMTELQPAAFASVKTMVLSTDEERSIAMQATEAAGLMMAPQRPDRILSSSLSEPAIPTLPKKERIGAGALAPLGRAIMVESDSDTTLVEAALMSSLLPRARPDSIGYFRLLSFGKGADPKLEFMRGTEKYSLSERDSFDAMVGMHVDEAQQLFALGQEEEIFSRIIDKFMAYCEGKDFVMVSGARITSRGALGAPGSSSFYAKLALALNLPLLLVHDMKNTMGCSDMTVDSSGVTRSLSVEALKASMAGFKANATQLAVRLAGAIVTGLPEEQEKYDEASSVVRTALDGLGIYPAALLPHCSRMEQLTMAEVAHDLDATVMYGGETLSSQFVQNVEVGTRQLKELISTVQQKPGTLVVASAARFGFLLGMLMATQSKNVPKIPGILLTQAKSLSKEQQHILDGLDYIGKPVLMTDLSSYEAASRIHQLQQRPHPLASAVSKREAAERLMDGYLEPDFMEAALQDDASHDVTPILFNHNMFSKARMDKQTIVLPEGLDIRVVTAAAELVQRGLCDVTLCGDPKVIQQNADKAHVDVSGCNIIHPQDVLYDNPQPWAEDMVNAFYEARKHKEIKSLDMAREVLANDRAYFGTMMMYQGLAHGMVSGTRQSTANTMRPALQLIKMQPGFKNVSSVFFMMLRDKVYVYGDCAINVDPNPEQLAEIAVASADTARAFGVQPRVAMLSYATGDSNKGPMIDKVIKATALAKELAPDELIDGPFQIDAAVDPDVAAVKFPSGGPVAGKATVCIFPDLNAANNGYKAVQQATKTCANGPIMQGLRMPVNDLSRGATVEDIVNTVVATVLQAQDAKRKAAAKGGSQ